MEREVKTEMTVRNPLRRRSPHWTVEGGGGGGKKEENNPLQLICNLCFNLAQIT